MSIESEDRTVTFAILTYNQIDFIEESIKGAFSQDYPNLEIIISDDCSTDGTFEKIKEIISNYKGKHKICLNQTSKNKCILGHFFDIIDLAKGELLVLSAGDDISKSDRVTKMVKIWNEEKAVGIFSNYKRIDENGRISEGVYNPSTKSKLLTAVFNNKNGLDIHGASSAYDMKFLKSLPRVEGRFFFEDTFMSFMITIFGNKILKIDEPLVFYRFHSESISNLKTEKSSISNIQSAESRASFYAKNKYDLYIKLRKIALDIPKSKINKKFNIRELDGHIEKLRIKSSWIDLSYIKRISYIFKYKKDKEFCEWMFPRILGLKGFAVLKATKNKL